MTDVIVTAGTILSKAVPEEKLCETMKSLLEKGEGFETTCANCEARLMRTSYHGQPSIISSNMYGDKHCSTVESMKERIGR